MSEEPEKKEGEAEAAEAPKKKSKKMLFIIIGAVVLLGGGGAGFMLMGGSPPPEGEDGAPVEEAHEAPKEFKMAEMDVFIVNLSESTSFLKVKMNIEYDPEIVERIESAAHGEAHGGGGAGGEKAENPYAMPHPLLIRMPQIRDAVIRVMSSKRAADVLTVDGKEKLKQELIEAINEATGLEEGPIVNIYFTEFLIQ